MTAQRNTMWASRVRRLLSEGYGVEDIAVIMKHSADDVRREVEILRASGELTKIYGLREAPKWTSLGALVRRIEVQRQIAKGQI